MCGHAGHAEEPGVTLSDGKPLEGFMQQMEGTLTSSLRRALGLLCGRQRREGSVETLRMLLER